MIGPPISASGAAQILVATKPVDFRKQADSLAALVQEELGADPLLCVGRDYVAESRVTPARAGGVRISSPHNNQMLFSSCRTASFGRKRALRSPGTPGLSSPRRIISTSAAA
jgi:IS66 Orf2 like protein